ncbi:MAG: ribbon-helix-helix domain-containing protein [Candidatus Anammoxibacter sp.]
MRTLKKKPIQIYIDRRQDDVLEVLSKKRGISKAELIRKSLDTFLNSLPIDEDPAMGIIGLGSSGKSDISTKHDKYLVGYTNSHKKK